MDKKVELITKLIITYCFILGICYLLYNLVILPISEAEKVSAIIGLLGWSATIFAPISAFFFLSSWKEQTQYNTALEKIEEMIEQLSILVTQLEEIRNKQNVFLFLNNYLNNKNRFEELCKSSSNRFDFPSFADAYKTLENIRIINLKILLVGAEINTHIFESNDDDFDSFSKLESCIKGLEASFVKLKLNKNITEELNDSKDLLYCSFYISSLFYKSYISTVNPSIENKYLDQLNQAIEACFEDLKKFRVNLK